MLIYHFACVETTIITISEILLAFQTPVRQLFNEPGIMGIRPVQDRYFLHVPACVYTSWPLLAQLPHQLQRFFRHFKHLSGSFLTSPESWESVHCKLDILSMLSARLYSFNLCRQHFPKNCRDYFGIVIRWPAAFYQARPGGNPSTTS